MTSICRFCCSSSYQLTNSINDDLILKLLDFLPQIVLSDDRFLSTSVCQLCYGKAKISLSFISKISESQKSFKLRLKNKESRLNKFAVTPDEVLKKMQQISGISIKKVFKTDPINIPSSSEPDEAYLEEMDVADDDSSGSGEVFEVYDGESDSSDDFKPGTSKDVGRKAIKKTKVVYIEAPINFSCAKCKATFFEFSTLQTHMKARTCFKEEFVCNICSKQFKSRKNLGNHMVTHRPKESMEFICEQCGMDFRSQFDLDSHMESLHRRVVKRDCIYRCTHCQEVYSSHLDLLEHVKEHNDEKKNALRLCEICARECPNLKSYQAHMAIHRDKKSFVCDMCGKGFMKAYQLTQHMHIHTGLKSFVCDICQRSFAKRESLRLHKKKLHPV